MKRDTLARLEQKRAGYLRLGLTKAAATVTARIEAMKAGGQRLLKFKRKGA